MSAKKDLKTIAQISRVLEKIEDQHATLRTRLEELGARLAAQASK